MEFCVGTFLTALKLAKASSTRQKQIGVAVFKGLDKDFNMGDDDSAISAVFRGARNINSYLRIEIGDIVPKELVRYFEQEVVPLLDENKFGTLVKSLQDVISQDDIGDGTHVELVNGIKKSDLVRMDKIVLGDFLAGLFIYALKNTNNLHKEYAVKEFKQHFEESYMFGGASNIKFISQYTDSAIFNKKYVRPIQTIYNMNGKRLDIVCVDLFDVEKEISFDDKSIIVVSVNTSFETKLEEKRDGEYIPLVSQKTIHGQWITYMSKLGYDAAYLDSKIENSLRSNRFYKCGSRDSIVGKQDVYPLGSIALLRTEKIDYYLLALSEFDNENKANSSRLNIENAVIELVDYYDRNGQGNDMYIPLLGTGRSRVGLTLSESFNIIKRILLSQIDRIYGRIHIVILPKQLEEIDLEVCNELL